MYQKDFEQAYKEWEKDLKDWFTGYKLWQEGKHLDYDGEARTIEQIRKDILKDIEETRERERFDDNYKHDEYDVWKYEPRVYYSDYSGDPPSPPNPDDYMPTGTWYQLYETVSEGTPLSPPFKTKEQLVVWLSNNKDFWKHTWTREQAEAMVRDEWAPSMIVSNGKVYTAEESVLLKRKETK